MDEGQLSVKYCITQRFQVILLMICAHYIHIHAYTYISSSVFIGHSPVDRSFTFCLNFRLISHRQIDTFLSEIEQTSYS